MNEQVRVFHCEDSYEADKILGFFSDKDPSQFVLNVEYINNNEIIIKLKDNSCHSVLMKDHLNAIEFSNFFKDSIKGEKVVKKIMKDNLIRENLKIFYFA